MCRRPRASRLHIDFTKRCVKIYESAAQMPMQGWQSAPARMRFGSLLMVPGEIMGVRVNVLIDTGAEEDRDTRVHPITRGALSAGCRERFTDDCGVPSFLRSDCIFVVARLTFLQRSALTECGQPVHWRVRLFFRGVPCKRKPSSLGC
jgi:hypothetical protein